MLAKFFLNPLVIVALLLSLVSGYFTIRHRRDVRIIKILETKVVNLRNDVDRVQNDFDRVKGALQVSEQNRNLEMDVANRAIQAMTLQRTALQGQLHVQSGRLVAFAERVRRDKAKIVSFDPGPVDELTNARQARQTIEKRVLTNGE